MSRRLYRQERLDLILDKLQQTGYVSVSELSDDLGVSAVTIRTDLDSLEADGQLQRTHGGAVPLHSSDEILSFSARQRTQAQIKDRIGAAAAALVRDGESVVLDASTTAWHMARHLLNHRDLAVVTTGLHVAVELLRAPGINVMIPGGRIWRESGSVIGPSSRPASNDINLQKVFFSGRGFTMETGLSDPNRDEVELKREYVRAGREITVMVDSSKFGTVAFSTIVSVDQIHRLITDQDAPVEILEALRERGVEVIVV
ncbi:MAG: DeoR/GlpR transcriptional regulator [Chloroflexi bacterium]|nr:DeoR/GlpR transcriptional regulator [Chloroflexota bacterium]